ncbi:MAG: NAD kinase, partial [Burkholderiales bacterium]
MKTQYRQVALIGKYQAAAVGTGAAATRAALEDIAQFLHSQGC